MRPAHHPAAAVTKGKPTREVWYYEHPYPPGAKSYSKTKPIRLEEFQPERKWWTKREETPQAWRVSIDEIAAANFNLDFKNPHRLEEEEADVEALIARHMEIEAKAAATRERLKQELAAALSAH